MTSKLAAQEQRKKGVGAAAIVVVGLGIAALALSGGKKKPPPGGGPSLPGGSVGNIALSQGPDSFGIPIRRDSQGGVGDIRLSGHRLPSSPVATVGLAHRAPVLATVTKRPGDLLRFFMPTTNSTTDGNGIPIPWMFKLRMQVLSFFNEEILVEEFFPKLTDPVPTILMQPGQFFLMIRDVPLPVSSPFGTYRGAVRLSGAASNPDGTWDLDHDKRVQLDHQEAAELVRIA